MFSTNDPAEIKKSGVSVWTIAILSLQYRSGYLPVFRNPIQNFHGGPAIMSFTNQKLHFGAAYYPEHWSEERWSEDIRLMKAAGMTVVRMAEFAWSTLQSGPDNFNFDWLERALTGWRPKGIDTVLGTPTAAPPAWLVQKYPDLLAVDESGRRVQFGNRCHYCVNSPEFHSASQQIVKAMADRFGDDPHVIGWQIDNEYNRVCYCERCQSSLPAVPAGQIRFSGSTE